MKKDLLKRAKYKAILIIASVITLSMPTIANAAAPTVFNYTGATQSFTAPIAGIYTINVYGASGGTGFSSGYGGEGGYATGEIALAQEETIYFYVGQQGYNETGNGAAGGWNGGGSVGNGYNGNAEGGGGGGATDVRTVSGGWNDTASLQSRVIIAGGGGGGANQNGGTGTAGAGGGLTGTNSSNCGTGISLGGAQTSTGSGGSLGCGGSSSEAESTGGGGGGGYYGGAAGGNSDGSQTSGGGGGSGYIGGVTSGTMQTGVRSGNGCANIVYTATPAPSAPTGLAASNIASSTLTLTWQNQSGILGYKIYNNLILVGTSTLPTFNAILLQPTTNYSFTVTANNTTGDSAQSAPLTLTTPLKLSKAQKFQVVLASSDGSQYYNPDTKSTVTLNLEPVSDQLGLASAGSGIFVIKNH